MFETKYCNKNKYSLKLEKVSTAIVKFKFANGIKIKDKLTGFIGIVVVQSFYFNGCRRYGIQGLEMKDGKPSDWIYLDEEQIEEIKEKPVIKRKRNKRLTGGSVSMDAPKIR